MTADTETKATQNPMRQYGLNAVLLIALIFHIGGLISVWGGYYNAFFNDTSHRIGKGADFFQFYQAGHDLLEGNSIYHPTDRIAPYQVKFHYLPPIALIGMVFQFLRPFTAYGTWVVIMELLYILGAIHIRKFCPNKTKYRAVLCLWFGFTPWYPDIYLGQINIVMALLLIFLILGLKKTDRICGGVIYGLSLLVKLWTLLLAPLWIKLRRFHILTTGFIILVIGTLPYYLWRPDDFILMVKYTFGGQTQITAGNLGWHPVLFHLAWITGLENHVTLLTRGFVVIILCLSLLGTLKFRDEDPVILLILWVLTYFIGYKFAWEHHYIMLLPVLAYLGANRSRWAVWVPAIIIALPTPFFFLDPYPKMTLYDPGFYMHTGPALFYHMIKPACVLILYIQALGVCLGQRVRALWVWVIASVCTITIIAANMGLGARTARDAEVSGIRSLMKWDYESAASDFQLALARKPDYANAMVFLARTEFFRGDKNAAIKAMDRLPELSKFPDEVLPEGIRLYERAGQPEKAEALKKRYNEVYHSPFSD